MFIPYSFREATGLPGPDPDPRTSTEILLPWYVFLLYFRSFQQVDSIFQRYSVSFSAIDHNSITEFFSYAEFDLKLDESIILSPNNTQYPKLVEQVYITLSWPTTLLLLKGWSYLPWEKGDKFNQLGKSSVLSFRNMSITLQSIACIAIKAYSEPRLSLYFIEDKIMGTDSRGSYPDWELGVWVFTSRPRRPPYTKTRKL